MKRNPIMPLRVVPLGGLGEIGMNCMVMEYAEERIVIDCGVLFSDLDDFGVEYIIPNFQYLLSSPGKVQAIVITHGHEDHIGALPYLIRAGIYAPIYATEFTARLVEARLSEFGLLEKTPVKRMVEGKSLKTKHFTVTPIAVNHSIVEASALVVETPVGKVLHTGDFKIDPHPFYGKPIRMETFQKLGDEGVLLMLSDSTNIEVRESSGSDRQITESFERILAATEGMIVVTMFASNVARIGQILQLAGKMNKKVALTGRSLQDNARIARECGYLKESSSTLIDLSDIDEYDRKNLIVVATGSQGEVRSALNRIANQEHREIKLKKGDVVIMSSKMIPGNELAIARVINNLFRQGSEVIYEALHEVHVSGHATRPELKQMLQAVKPKYFIPIHGEYRHLVHHRTLACETGVAPENAILGNSGDTLELTEDSCRVVANQEHTRVMVDSPNLKEMARSVLKDRRRLAECGMICCVVAIDIERGKLVSGPFLEIKGLVGDQRVPEITQECVKVVQKTVHDYRRDLIDGKLSSEDMEEAIRVDLRRLSAEKFGKKTSVITIVLTPA